MTILNCLRAAVPVVLAAIWVALILVWRFELVTDGTRLWAGLTFASSVTALCSMWYLRRD